MEIKATLQKPYDEIDKLDFIVTYNHELGYTIEETEDELQALGYTEEEIALQEKERIAKLTCTKRVFALMLQELGITYTMLKQLIATNEQAQLEWDLCVELERSNPLLDVMALQLGITSEQLDGLFRYANGEITIEQFREMYITEEPPVDNSEPVEEQEPLVDDIPDGEDVNNLEE
jgi:hypothetical protein